MKLYSPLFPLHFKDVLFFSVNLNPIGTELKISCDPALGSYQSVSSVGARGGRGGDEEGEEGGGRGGGEKEEKSRV